MRSPVSSRALGECNAITSLRFGSRGLTFSQRLGNRVPASACVSLLDGPRELPVNQQFQDQVCTELGGIAFKRVGELILQDLVDPRGEAALQVTNFVSRNLIKRQAVQCLVNWTNRSGRIPDRPELAGVFE